MVTVAKENDELAEAFGRRLRLVRKAKGLTQQELADRIGQTMQAISRLETGGSVPSFETLLKLAEALDCELNEFHPGHEPEPPPPEPDPPARAARPMGKRK
jgi:transcriptional regulator with XRE-family HTH domain